MAVWLFLWLAPAEKIFSAWRRISFPAYHRNLLEDIQCKRRRFGGEQFLIPLDGVVI
jgi:hypothetical protein